MSDTQPTQDLSSIKKELYDYLLRHYGFEPYDWRPFPTIQRELPNWTVVMAQLWDENEWIDVSVHFENEEWYLEEIDCLKFVNFYRETNDDDEEEQPEITEEMVMNQTDWIIDLVYGYE